MFAPSSGQADDPSPAPPESEAGQAHSAADLDSRLPPRRSRAAGKSTDRPLADSAPIRRSLFPTLASPAVEVVLETGNSLADLPGSRGVFVDDSTARTERDTSPPGFARPSTRDGARALFETTRQISEDAVETASELERFGRRIMRGARILGGEAEPERPVPPRRFEARLAPGWRRGPVAQFQFYF